MSSTALLGIAQLKHVTEFPQAMAQGDLVLFCFKTSAQIHFDVEFDSIGGIGLLCVGLL